MKKSFTLLVLFLALFFSAQAQVYVDKNHTNAVDDSAHGSEAMPWKTIQYGVNQLNPGDILYIKAGTYFEKINIDVSGTVGNTITIRNFANDEVIISGAQALDNTPLIWTDNAYLRIEGLHLTENEFNFSNGLTLQGTAHHIEVVNNKVSKINFSPDPNAPVNGGKNSVPMSALGDAASVGGAPPDSVHHISFIGNEIFNNRTGYSENLTVGGNISNFLIENNHVHDNKNIGIDATGNYGESPVPEYDHPRYGNIRNNHIHDCKSNYSPAAGIYIDGGKNIIVENNLCYRNGYGGEIGCEKTGETANITYRNNVFHHNLVAGLHVGGYDIGPGKEGVVVNANIYNNTFYQNAVNSANGPLILTRSKDCNIFNNIFYIDNHNVLLYAYRTQTNLFFDYNLVYSVNKDATTIATTVDGANNGGTSYVGLAAFYTATGYGTHSLFGDPLFTDEATGDFHIASNSPAVNKGDPNHTPAPEELDLDGEARAVGVVDMGVDEQAAPLPVEYLSPFQGRLASKGILLSWATTTEINADKFIIQRLSQNNQWENIQTVFAGKQSYQTLDVDPQKGINVYRLKQLDIDGQFSLSKMVSVVWEEARTPSPLFPNPTTGTSNFIDGEFYKIEVVNVLGQVVFLSEKTNKIPKLEKGIYGVNIFELTGEKLSTVKLVME